MEESATEIPATARLSPAILAGAIALMLVLSWRGECWAYIDPNAGGFLWQVLAPLASIFLSFLFYCRNEIKKLVKSIRNRWKGIDPDRAEPGVRS
jgi:hypothetical protein